MSYVNFWLFCVMKKIKLAVSPFLITLKYVLSTAYQCTRLEIYQHKAENPKMSRIVLATWASSKFGAHLTLSTISHVLKKHTDLESLTDTKLSAKKALSRRSESEAGGGFVNMGRSMPDKECCPNWRNHQGQGQCVSWMTWLTWGNYQVFQWMVATISEAKQALQHPDLRREWFSKWESHGCSIAWTSGCNCSLRAPRCFLTWTELVCLDLRYPNLV